MKILITGAAGQIGSGLAKRLCDKHELTLVDNLRNGYAEHLKDDEDWDEALDLIIKADRIISI